MKRLSIVTIAFASLMAGCAINLTDQINQIKQRNALSALRKASKPLSESVCAKDNPIIVKSVRNRHVPNLTDRIETKRCAAGSIQTYISTAASNPNGLPMWLEVTQPNPTLPKYAQVGESASPLTTYLGKPTSTTNGNLVYALSKSGDSVTFVVKNERISSVRWEWYLD